MQYSLGWEDLRLVLAIGRGGSLAAAARALHVDHSTVHRRIGRIEKHLGVRLFERLRTGYTPTPAGEEALATALRVDDDVVRLQNKLAGEDMRPTGIVRLSTSDTMLLAVLDGILARLRRARPEIRLEVGTTVSSVNLTRREADIAVRVTDDPPDYLVGRRVGTILMAVYGRRDERGESGRGERADSTDHDWVGFDEALRHTPAGRWMAANVPADRIVYRCDTSMGMAAAVRSGVGIAPLPAVLGDPDTALERVQPAPMPDFARPMWLLTHRNIARVARIRAVMDFLASEIPEAIARTAAAADTA